MSEGAPRSDLSWSLTRLVVRARDTSSPYELVQRTAYNSHASCRISKARLRHIDYYDNYTRNMITIYRARAVLHRSAVVTDPDRSDPFKAVTKLEAQEQLQPKQSEQAGSSRRPK